MKAASYTPWKAWDSSVRTDVLTPMEKLAILRLDQLGRKFFKVIFPFLMPSDPGDVETIAGVRARDDPCGWFLLGYQDDLWGVMLRTGSN